jgi:hypothetical protein
MNHISICTCMDRVVEAREWQDYIPVLRNGKYALTAPDACAVASEDSLQRKQGNRQRTTTSERVKCPWALLIS